MRVLRMAKSAFIIMFVVPLIGFAISGCGPSANDIDISDVDIHTFQVSLSLDGQGAPGAVRGAITAIDPDGDVVPLTAGEIRIFESTDRKNWKETTFTTRSRGEAYLPISAAVCMDSSGSMTGEKEQDSEQAVLAFFDYLVEGDRLAIVKFAEDVKTPQDFTDVRSELEDAVKYVIPGFQMGTALWDAAYEGVKLAKPEAAPKAALITSDGEDNASTKVTASELIEKSVAAGVPIFSLGMSPTDDTDGMKYLFKVSSETGGLFWYFTDTFEMADVYVAIAKAFNQALVATWPSQFTGGQVYVKVEVKTDGGDEGTAISSYSL
jgi:hypothetical protein